jgi:hypothetical protein
LGSCFFSFFCYCKLFWRLASTNSFSAQKQYKEQEGVPAKGESNMHGASASDQTGIQHLPYELVRYILVEFTDCEARVMSYLVCRDWRRQLWAGRRYHWRQANVAFAGCRAAWVRRMACAAIARGHPAVGLWLLANMPHTPSDGLPAHPDLCPLVATVCAGDLTTRSALRALGWRWAPEIMGWPLASDEVDIIDQVIEDCGSRQPDICRTLAYSGDLSRLRRLVERGVDVVGNHAVMSAALYQGRTNVVEWLLAQGASAHHAKGRIVSRHWFHETPLEEIEWAAARGYIDINAKTTGKFASRGRLDVVQWAHANVGVPLDDAILRKAVRGGQCAVVAWLLDQGVAGTAGQTARECCQWLIRDQGTDDAALKAVIEPLLDANIGGLCSQDIECAAQCDRLAMLRWMLERVWGSVDSTSLHCRSVLWLKCLAGASHRVGEWMLSIGWAPPNDAIRRVTRRRSFDHDSARLVGLLADHGCLCTADDCAMMAQHGHQGLLQRAVVDHGASWNPHDCLVCALSVGSPEHRATVTWIAHHAGINAEAFERDLLNGNAPTQT